MKCFGELQSLGSSFQLSPPELKGHKSSLLRIIQAIWLVALWNFGVFGQSDERWISNHQGIHHPFMQKQGVLPEKGGLWI